MHKFHVLIPLVYQHHCFLKLFSKDEYQNISLVAVLGAYNAGLRLNLVYSVLIPFQVLIIVVLDHAFLIRASFSTDEPTKVPQCLKYTFTDMKPGHFPIQ